MTTLKRSINLPLLCFYGLGTILGAGIYVLVGKVAGAAGLYAPIAFLVAALIAGLTGLSYAELSARMPRSGGEAVYVEQAFHRRWLSGLIGWGVVATGLVSAATICRGFVGYLELFVHLPELLVITLLVLAMVVLAAWGIAESVGIAAAITLLELLGLLLVVVGAGDNFATLPIRWRELVPGFEWQAWLSIAVGAFLAFYAFIGFEDMVNIAEEVKEPQRVMPRAIIIALLIATPLYVVVAVLAVLALPIDQLAESRAPLADILDQGSWVSAQWIAVISLIAALNGALVQIIMASRVVYGMARQGNAPGSMSHVNASTRTPVRATVLVGGLVWLMAILFPLVTLASITSLIILVVFAVVNLSLLSIKRGGPGPVNIPFWIPGLGAVLCLLLVALQVGGQLLGGQ